jgi:16S rRNA (guanine527-N7)-methyltransferase
MEITRIAQLLEPFLSSPHSDGRSREGSSAAASDHRLAAIALNISTYIDLLLRWNARMNLTAIRDPEEIVARHFGESLFTARHLFSGSPEAGRRKPGAPRLADVGTGAGFPGIPIKLYTPQIHLTLIESSHKKATFLREVTRALTLTDVDIQNTRAEALALSSFDVVTLRAVEHFETVLPTAARLVVPQGRLALLIGDPQVSQAEALLPHFTFAAPLPIPLSRSRSLLISHLAKNQVS